MGYQVRCSVLHACDYGDPQKRPRFFMFVAKNNVPIPSFPSVTHGSGPQLWPYVTIKDAFSRIKNDSTLLNVAERRKYSKSTPGKHGIVRLMPYDLAPTIRASSIIPFHYCKNDDGEDQCISVREAATLQSFPLWYKFHGTTLTSKYRQIGNAVPIELSTAVAQSVRQVLLYEYQEAVEDVEANNEVE